MQYLTVREYMLMPMEDRLRYEAFLELRQMAFGPGELAREVPTGHEYSERKAA